MNKLDEVCLERYNMTFGELQSRLIVANKNSSFMGWNPFKDIGNFITGALEGIGNIISVSVKFIIKDIIKPIIKSLKPLFKDLTHLMGNFLIYTNVFSGTYRLLKSWKVTKHLIGEIDKYTGHLLTDLDNVQTLFPRLIKGDKISKEELISDALFAVRVGVVVLSGGTAAGVTSGVSSQLRQGKLGETQLGGALLDIATIASVSAVTGQSASALLEKKVVDTGTSMAAGEAIKHTSLGNSPEGRLLIGGTFAAAGGVVQGGAANEALVNLGKSSARDIAILEVTKVLPIPNKKIAGYLVDNISNLSDALKIPDLQNLDIDPKKIVKAVSNAVQDIPEIAAHIIERIPKEIENIPSQIEHGVDKLPDEISHIADQTGTNISNIPDVLTNVGSKAGETIIKGIEDVSKLPEGFVDAVSKIPEIDPIKVYDDLKKLYSKFQDFKKRICKKVNSLNAEGLPIQVEFCRQSLGRMSLGGTKYLYYFDDGSYDIIDDYSLYLMMGLGAAAILLISQIGDD